MEKTKQKNTDTSKVSNKWKAIFENARDLIITINYLGIIKEVNRSLEGAPREGLIGKNYFDYIDADNQVEIRKNVLSLFSKGTTYHYELKNKIAGFGVHYSSNLATTVKDEKGEVCEVLIISRDITSIKETERQVLESFLKVEQRDRMKIAYDIHESVGQKLSAIHMNFDALKHSLSEKDIAGKVSKQLLKLDELIKSSLSEIRLISHNLMPSTLSKFGLEETIRQLFKNISGVGVDMEFDFYSTVKKSRYDEMVEIAIFRMVQELINNAVKHSAAKLVQIKLWEEDNFIQLVVQDDGIGFKPEYDEKGIGLKGLVNRVQKMGGSYEMKTEPGEGLMVKIKVPVNKNNGI